MTQIGKCDTCRSRKVKCDEAKPICSACRKKNRPCTYTYGRSKALVREDPPHFSGHGKAKLAPLVSPLISSYIEADAASSSQGDLRLTSKTEAGEGHGAFHTFSLPTKGRKAERIEAFIKKQEWEEALFIPTIPAQPSFSDSLAARCMYMFGPQTWDLNSRAIHGTWIEAIPPRIGSSLVLDTAVEYAMNSFATYGDRSYAAQRTAVISRGKALKSLREAMEQYQGSPNFDIVFATKLHSFAEIFVATGTMGYTTHCIGLSELLKNGCANGVERVHHWSLVDNTYIDEVTEAIICGRPSVFDCPTYIALTDPASFPPSSPLLEYQIESTSVMHCWIRLPRLACLIRRSVEDRDDTHILSSALSLAKTLWDLDPSPVMDKLIQSSSTYVAVPPYAEVGDIITGTLDFHTVHPLLVCNRYWALRIYLSSMIQTLWEKFPKACVAGSMPAVETLQELEIDASKHIVMSLSGSLHFARTLPLVPLRILSPLALSVGPWYRILRRLSDKRELLDTTSGEYASCSLELEKAKRMEDWTIEQCNCIHDTWGVGRASKARFEALIPLMAGGEVPNWIPNRTDWEQAKQQLTRQHITI